MMSILDRSTVLTGLAWAVCLSFLSFQSAHSGVHYGDPGWFYIYQGDEAFYNDPDGPNPDYINGDDSNKPGGQGGTAALVFPGFTDDPGCNPDTGDGCSVDNENAEWIHQSSNWEGSAPGDPLGGVAGGSPPIPPPAPGGVGAFSDDNGTTFLRIQDTGQPQNWGWPDKGAQAMPGSAIQEGNNRKIQFGHKLDQDDQFSGDQAVIDNGITISFRTRLATAATGPLDDIYVEGGPSASPGGAPVAWPADGLGHEVANDGRGMFQITQTTGGFGGEQMAFSLLDNDTIVFEGLQVSRTGLVLNNRDSPGQDVDTNEATEATLNIFEIDDMELQEWQEFWITIEEKPDGEGNTHEANIYHNGELDEPQTFQFILSGENEFGNGAHLGMGLSSGSRQSAYDIDFYAYMEGIVLPVEPPPTGNDGDYNGDGVVNAGDYNVWRNTLGQDVDPGTGADGDGDGMITEADYVHWKGLFGTVIPSPSSAAIPEPASATILLTLAAIGVVARYRRD